MAEPARSSRHDLRGRGTVRPLSRAATRRCSRPGCPSPATATLSFRYDERHALLTALMTDGGPETYDLCREHADRTRPPHGWSIADRRPEDVPVAPPDVEELGSAHTVAVLAAALRGDGDTLHAVPDAAPLDTAALDAIAEAPFDEPGLDLLGARDEADPPVLATPAVDVAAHDEEHHAAIVEQVPARSVPAARRPH